MKINRRFVTLILLLMLLADESKATYSIWGLKRIINESPIHNYTPQNIPPVPSPLPLEKELKGSPNDGNKSTNDKAKDLQVSNDPEKSNPKTHVASPPIEVPVVSGTNDVKKEKNDGNKSTNDKAKDIQVSNDPEKSIPKTHVTGPPTEVPVGSGTNDVKKEKNDGNADSKSVINESCEGSTEPCKLLKNLTACIRSLKSGSKEFVLLILNEGEIPLKVNVTMPTSLTNAVNEHVIPEKKTERTSISSSVEQGSKILLKAGDEKCSLLVGAVTIQSNFLQQIPSYYKQITPVYVAYFIFLVALIIGGTCACCQLRKRKRQDEVPYQELEMGISESACGANVETADGWDDGWDDNWDEDKAVKSPGHRAVGISANGLTARTSKQDGWGKDWDD